MERADTGEVVVGIARDRQVPHLGMDEPVDGTARHDGPAADARSDGDVDEVVQPLGGTPTALGHGRTVDIGVEPDGDVERGAHRPHEIRKRPPGLGRGDDVSEPGVGGPQLDGPEGRDADRVEHPSRGRELRKKAIVRAIVSSGNVVGNRVSSMTSPLSDATTHTNLVPPASMPPNVMAASTRLDAALKSSYNYPCRGWLYVQLRQRPWHGLAWRGQGTPSLAPTESGGTRIPTRSCRFAGIKRPGPGDINRGGQHGFDSKSGHAASGPGGCPAPPAGW